MTADTWGSPRRPAKVAPPLKSTSRRLSCSGWWAVTRPRTSVRSSSDLPEPVAPMTSPWGPAPPRAASSRSSTTGWPSGAVPSSTRSPATAALPVRTAGWPCSSRCSNRDSAPPAPVSPVSPAPRSSRRRIRRANASAQGWSRPSAIALSTRPSVVCLSTSGPSASLTRGPRRRAGGARRSRVSDGRVPDDGWDAVTRRSWGRSWSTTRRVTRPLTPCVSSSPAGTPSTTTTTSASSRRGEPGPTAHRSAAPSPCARETTRCLAGPTAGSSPRSTRAWASHLSHSQRAWRPGGASRTTARSRGSRAATAWATRARTRSSAMSDGPRTRSTGVAPSLRTAGIPPSRPNVVTNLCRASSTTGSGSCSAGAAPTRRGRASGTSVTPYLTRRGEGSSRRQLPPPVALTRAAGCGWRRSASSRCRRAAARTVARASSRCAACARRPRRTRATRVARLRQTAAAAKVKEASNTPPAITQPWTDPWPVDTTTATEPTAPRSGTAAVTAVTAAPSASGHGGAGRSSRTAGSSPAAQGRTSPGWSEHPWVAVGVICTRVPPVVPGRSRWSQARRPGPAAAGPTASAVDNPRIRRRR